MTDRKTDWYIIVNPHAGSGKTMSLWAEAEDLLSSYGVSYKAVLTNRKFHAKELATEAAAVGYRHILAVGGDGSVHEMFAGVLDYAVGNGIDTREFYLGVIPIGSGNDWIKSVGTPHDISDVVRLVSEESFTLQDVVSVESEGARCYMANIGGVGFDSHVCDNVNTLKERGHRSKRIYFNALLRTVFTLKPFRGSVICDGGTAYSGSIYSIALGNGNYSGGGMQQVPSADINDGLLNVMVVPRVPLHTILLQLPRLLNGTIEKAEPLIFRTGKTIEIRQEPSERTVRAEQIVEVDGEIEGRLPMKACITGMKVNVLCGHLR